MKNKIALAMGLIVVGISPPLFADSMKTSYSFNQANGYPGDGEQNINGQKGYFPLSGNGKFITAGRSGLALTQDVMVVGGLAPFNKDIPLTISLWIKPTHDAAGGTILSRKHTDNGQGFSVAFDFDMNLEFSLVDEFGGSIAVASLAPVVVDGMWHHIAVSYKGDANASNMALYIDGQATELKLSSNSLSGQVETYHPLVIGGGSSYSQALAAEIDEVYLVPQIFNAEQVTCLYQLKTDCAYRPTTGQEGPRGPIGDLGEQGVRGASGASGLAGDVGLKGSNGLSGPVGAQGPIGPQGFTGPTGLAGVDGSDGIDGSDGFNGAPGAQGAVGDSGIQGPQGSKGLQGSVGPKGPSGDRGAQGAMGNQGIAGIKGAQGLQGPTGYTGGAGVAGPIGNKGPTGPNGNGGLQGIPGGPGDNGPKGYTGPAGDNIAGYQGDKGATGPVGPRGRQPSESECSGRFGRFIMGSPEPLPKSMASLTSNLAMAVKGEVELTEALPELDGVIDAEFILSKAMYTSEAGLVHINLNVLAVENKQEADAFFSALDVSDQAAHDYIVDLYTQKNLDNRYAAEINTILAMPSPLKIEKRAQ